MINRVGQYFLFCLLLIASLAGPHACVAQLRPHFEQISSHSGLSENDIFCMLQDSTGFLWFGTDDGLNRYDGYDFTVYHSPGKGKGLAGNQIRQLKEGPNGTLWIGTNFYGLSHFDTRRQVFTNYRHQPDSLHSLSSDMIAGLMVDSQHRLWVTTFVGLDMRYPTDPPGHFRHVLSLPQHIDPNDKRRLRALAQMPDGSLYAGGKNGLFRITENPADTTFSLEKAGLQGEEIVTLHPGPDGRLYIGTTNELYVSAGTPASGKFTRVLDGTIFSVYANQKGEVWVGQEKRLTLMSPDKSAAAGYTLRHFTADANDTANLSSSYVRSVFEDKAGVVWVGTFGTGINKYDRNRKPFMRMTRSGAKGALQHNVIRVIFEDSNGTVWVGTHGGGLHYSTKGGDPGTFVQLTEVLSPSCIAEVSEKGKKYLHIGTSNGQGLFQVDITNPRAAFTLQHVYKDHQTITSVLQDKLGQVWYATYDSGLFKRRPDGKIYHYNKFSNQGIPGNALRKIFEDSKGNIWIGTVSGLGYLPAAQVGSTTPHFTTYPADGKAGSLPLGYVITIFEDSRGTIWIGTKGGGLCRFIPGKGTGHFKTYSEKEGLPNNTVRGILEDNTGNLWISTNNGLAELNPAKDVFRLYNIGDGLISREFQFNSCLKKADGTLWFGGTEGIDYFRPEEIRENHILPRPVLTAFSVWNKAMHAGEKFNGRVILREDIYTRPDITLKHHENSFSIEFSALHFSAPPKNRFAYRLLGFSDEWTYAGASRRYASYTGLPAGEYLFEVKASNNDGLWESHPARVRVTIRPPFWLTWPALLVYLAAAVALVYAYGKLTIMRGEEKHQLMLELIEKQKNEELYQNRVEFLTGIAHEIRTPLNLITGPLSYLTTNNDYLSAPERGRQYSLMDKSASFLTDLIAQLLNFRKIEEGKMRLEVTEADLVSFCREAIEPFFLLTGRRGIRLDLEASETPMITVFAPDAIKKILNNLLSNAVKFTPDGGLIRVGISQQEPGSKPEPALIRISVTDNGPGIPVQNIKRIFETFFISGHGNVKNEHGTGIGLPLSKGLAELHHGRVYLDRTYQEGARFVVEFPAGREAYANDAWIKDPGAETDLLILTPAGGEGVVAENEPDVPGSSPPEAKKTVLLVEDNAEMRAFVRYGISGSFTLIEAGNGADALEKLKETLPDFVVSDIRMPVMGGIELAQQIKSTRRLQHIPILFLTAITDSKSLIQALKTGADDYVTKPFTIELLRLKIENLGRNRGLLEQHIRKEVLIEPKTAQPVSTDEMFLARIIPLIEKNIMDTSFNVDVLVRELGMSRSHLYTKFKDITGQPANEFIRTFRLKRAHSLLENSDLSIKEVMFISGFNTASYFSKCFKLQYGILPSEVQRKVH